MAVRKLVHSVCGQLRMNYRGIAISFPSWNTRRCAMTSTASSCDLMHSEMSNRKFVYKKSSSLLHPLLRLALRPVAPKLSAGLSTGFVDICRGRGRLHVGGLRSTFGGLSSMSRCASITLIGAGRQRRKSQAASVVKISPNSCEALMQRAFRCLSTCLSAGLSTGHVDKRYRVVKKATKFPRRLLRLGCSALSTGLPQRFSTVVVESAAGIGSILSACVRIRAQMNARLDIGRRHRCPEFARANTVRSSLRAAVATRNA